MGRTDMPDTYSSPYLDRPCRPLEEVAAEMRDTIELYRAWGCPKVADVVARLLGLVEDEIAIREKRDG